MDNGTAHSNAHVCVMADNCQTIFKFTARKTAGNTGWEGETILFFFTWDEN